jgi:hypothetical protein
MSDQDTIAEARAAWSRIKNRDKSTFQDWVAIGRGLLAARAECMTRAKVNSPFGPGYQRQMRLWLDTNGMGDLDSHERYGAVLVFEHLSDIEAYRATLTEAERMRCCHPNTVLKHWRAGSAPQPQGPKPKPGAIHNIERRVESKVANYGPRPQRPEGDLIRRVAIAMQQSGSNDWFVRARVAIETLTVEDLRDLMPAKAARMGPAAVLTELSA